ncbi:hypothetical protein ACRRTK_008178 [Alexandromys fortis]
MSSFTGAHIIASVPTITTALFKSDTEGNRKVKFHFLSSHFPCPLCMTFDHEACGRRVTTPAFPLRSLDVKQEAAHLDLNREVLAVARRSPRRRDGGPGLPGRVWLHPDGAGPADPGTPGQLQPGPALRGQAEAGGQQRPWRHGGPEPADPGAGAADSGPPGQELGGQRTRRASWPAARLRGNKRSFSFPAVQVYRIRVLITPLTVTEFSRFPPSPPDPGPCPRVPKALGNGMQTFGVRDCSSFLLFASCLYAETQAMAEQGRSGKSDPDATALSSSAQENSGLLTYQEG